MFRPGHIKLVAAFVASIASAPSISWAGHAGAMAMGPEGESQSLTSGHASSENSTSGDSSGAGRSIDEKAGSPDEQILAEKFLSTDEAKADYTKLDAGAKEAFREATIADSKNSKADDKTKEPSASEIKEALKFAKELSEKNPSNAELKKAKEALEEKVTKLELAAKEEKRKADEAFESASKLASQTAEKLAKLNQTLSNAWNGLTDPQKQASAVGAQVALNAILPGSGTLLGSLTSTPKPDNAKASAAASTGTSSASASTGKSETPAATSTHSTPQSIAGAGAATATAAATATGSSTTSTSETAASSKTEKPSTALSAATAGSTIATGAVTGTLATDTSKPSQIPGTQAATNNQKSTQVPAQNSTQQPVSQQPATLQTAQQPSAQPPAAEKVAAGKGFTSDPTSTSVAQKPLSSWSPPSMSSILTSGTSSVGLAASAWGHATDSNLPAGSIPSTVAASKATSTADFFNKSASDPAPVDRSALPVSQTQTRQRYDLNGNSYLSSKATDVLLANARIGATSDQSAYTGTLANKTTGPAASETFTDRPTYIGASANTVTAQGSVEKPVAQLVEKDTYDANSGPGNFDTGMGNAMARDFSTAKQSMAIEYLESAAPVSGLAASNVDIRPSQLAYESTSEEGLQEAWAKELTESPRGVEGPNEDGNTASGLRAPQQSANSGTGDDAKQPADLVDAGAYNAGDILATVQAAFREQVARSVAVKPKMAVTPKPATKKASDRDIASMMMVSTRPGS